MGTLPDRPNHMWRQSDTHCAMCDSQPAAAQFEVKQGDLLRERSRAQIICVIPQRMRRQREDEKCFMHYAFRKSDTCSWKVLPPSLILTHNPLRNTALCAPSAPIFENKDTTSNLASGGDNSAAWQRMCIT
ncbi:hypothetical protein NQZ68_037725 [Dissostichus eleginoides]|nr:hypothetical protein NQZ68_037725 [Dissostichus eleginoides]